MTKRRNRMPLPIGTSGGLGVIRDTVDEVLSGSGGTSATSMT